MEAGKQEQEKEGLWSVGKHYILDSQVRIGPPTEQKWSLRERKGC